MANEEFSAAWLRCERCGGPMHQDPDGECTCLWCGEVRYPPAAPLWPAGVPRPGPLRPGRPPAAAGELAASMARRAVGLTDSSQQSRPGA